jgi:hypothetical protein
MNRKNRFVIAMALSIVLVLTAAGAWAAPKFQGTVPGIPVTGGGNCSDGTMDMGTALFTPQSTKCSIKVELIKEPARTHVSAPEGKIFTGDTFEVTSDPKDVIVQACYAYPPEFADKNAKIYKLNEDAMPNVWVEIPNAVIGKGTICVTSVVGHFSLIGNP